ncbi:hypothetical protein [Methylobacterium frigidaeris]|uniref:Uncharacterized protein n=1 Tax=Methylobacterium frigidaeris TaxID=2038277 RepID=A0AA37HGS3_9HYPH|nr:hypothetical protein [Methylobacterium frigidaeris]GJD65787.1 hypothetical protein MPEAHAMD_5983 [Methylobacterium frigidaeris]
MTEVYWHTRRRLWSIREGGRVVAHAPRVCLVDVTLVVKPGAVARIRLRGQREVCAWASGRRVPARALWGGEEPLRFSPFRDDAFVDGWGQPMAACRVLILETYGGDGIAWAER